MASNILKLICAQQLAENQCFNTRCRKIHDLRFFCRVCGHNFTSPEDLAVHNTSKRHVTRCRFGEMIALCIPCDRVFVSSLAYGNHCGANSHKQHLTAAVATTSAIPAVSLFALTFAASETFTSSYRLTGGAMLCLACDSLHIGKRRYEDHIATSQHLWRVAQEFRAARDGYPPPPKPPADYRYCIICSAPVFLNLWDEHVSGENHKTAERKAGLRALIDATEQSQYDVVVTHTRGIDFGTVDVSTLAENSREAIMVFANLANSGDVVFVKVQLLHPSSIFFASPQSHTSASLGVTASPIAEVAFIPGQKRGRFENRLELYFKENVSQKTFMITRKICAAVGSVANLTVLQNESSAIPLANRHHVRIGYSDADMILGEVPEPLKAIPWIVPLDVYKVPKSISRILDEGKLRTRIEGIRSVTPGKLIAGTYTNYWRTLLHSEEHQMEEDLERFNMSGVSLETRGRLHFLRVPGLAEKRPSVMIGDLIKAITSDGKVYGGFVHNVESLDVGLHFHTAFPGSRQAHDVEFSLCRIPLRRMHQALDQDAPLGHLLFPTNENVSAGLASTDEVKPFLYNSAIANNEPQLQAVASILSQPSGSTPFIIFGPPGSGKTVTIVEAILQILRRSPQARILACAPSNSAADIIAQRLVEFGNFDNSKLFRLVAPSRMRKLVPDDLRNFTYTNHRGVFSAPSQEDLARFQVVISTCVSACIPFGIGVLRGNFSHIFIDEAGQAMEPEVMIPIKTIADANTNIVLSGDPKQLGPVIHSPIARALGLEKGYLDRLMEMEMYNPRINHGRTIVKLIKNYRSHPAILRFPNEQFYEGELQACGDREMVNQLLTWDELGGRDFPIIFHGIRGKDDREGRSPSYFNLDEASLVSEYVEKLRNLGIHDKDIGVIAPYSAQCRKLRTLFQANYPNSAISVGSAEQFQGQERTAIIISTVRSSQDEIEFDLRHTLGFVANKRRFNVAITRAKALLIIVGDPVVLSLDLLWRQFMEYVRDNSGWKGAEMDADAEEDNDSNDGGDNGGDVEYAHTMRQRAEMRLERLIERWSAVGNNFLEEGDDDEDDSEDDQGHVAADVPWRETEE
ncbi:hypothetical protein BOTBODRAFT_39424 [Botryobasidium botryosum FD-172 SS1]|uniref:RNA helicase n=1 Tax=Botryobasidium botryosum (strain FD-172 SS1) TaxID=930990 RepID=A0A067M548_BOTB1|nr:hypothetical protein BOTBODRAFT_39424 [Botryobasidium botryosum FD-172 SS1]